MVVWDMVGKYEVTVRYRINDESLTSDTVGDVHTVKRNYDHDYLALEKKDGGQVSYTYSDVVMWEAGENVETQYR